MKPNEKRLAGGIGLWPALMLGLIAAGGTWLTSWTVQQADSALRHRLLAQADAVARQIEPGLVAALEFEARDKEKAQFQRLRSQMQAYAREALRNLETRTKYLGIYSLAKRGDAYCFGPESIEEHSPQASPPGTRYEKPPEALARAFESRLPQAVGPYTDEYGTYVSAFAPVLDPQSGEIVLVIGVDIEAREWRAELVWHCVEPLGFTLALLLIVASGTWVVRQFQRRAEGNAGGLARYAGAIPVAAAGVLVSLLVARIAHQLESRRHQETFLRLADAQIQHLEDWILHLRDDQLEGLGLFFEGSETVERPEFVTYTKHLARESGVQAWQWIPVIADHERSRFESFMRTSGLTNYTIWEGDGKSGRKAAGGRLQYYPIAFIEPLAGNATALGFDLGSEPARRAGLADAVRTGLPTATTPVTLVQETGSQKALLVFRPVHATTPPRQLKGFAVAVLRLDDVLQRIARMQAIPQRSLAYLELRWLVTNASPVVLASTAPTLTKGVKTPSGGHPLSFTTPLFTFGQTYALVARPTPGFAELYPARAGMLAGITGLGLTAMLVALVGLISRRHMELESQVRRRTAELHASRAHYQSLVETLPQGVFRKDREGRFTFVNAQFCRFIERPAEEVLGKTDNDLFPSELAAKYRQDDQQVMATGELFDTIEESRGPGGQARYVHVLKMPLRDAGRQVEGVQGIFWDVTERKCAEEELRHSHSLLHATLESTNDGFLVVDQAGRVTSFNQRFLQLWRIPPEMATTRDDAGLLEYVLAQLKDPEVFLANVRSLYAAPEKTSFDVLEFKDGRVFERYSQPQHLGTTIVGRVWSFRDVTQRQQAEEIRAQLEAQLRQAQKLEAVGQLAGGVAHDFNNILTALMMNLELLGETASLPPHVRSGLAEMAPLLQRAAALTRQLLLFARRGVMQRRVLDLNSLLGDLLKMLGRLIGEHIRLSFPGGQTALWINADHGMMEQVVTNLVVNARDALPHGGLIELSARKVEVDDAHVAAHPQARPGRFVCLAVRDTGTGMDEHTLKRLFEPFFTTKEVGKGTGLGLSTVQGIVQQHEGWIEVESSLGQGSTFRIYLPADESPQAEIVLVEAPAPVAGGSETILLVEDEAPVRRMVAQILSRHGYKVHQASHGQEALRLWSRENARVDLLLTDVVMPEGLDGFELAERLRDHRPELPVLLMTGYSAALMKRGFDVPPNTAFLQKPCAPSELLNTVRQLLDPPGAV